MMNKTQLPKLELEPKIPNYYGLRRVKISCALDTLFTVHLYFFKQSSERIRQLYETPKFNTKLYFDSYNILEKGTFIGSRMISDYIDYVGHSYSNCAIEVLFSGFSDLLSMRDSFTFRYERKCQTSCCIAFGDTVTDHNSINFLELYSRHACLTKPLDSRNSFDLDATYFVREVLKSHRVCMHCLEELSEQTTNYLACPDLLTMCLTGMKMERVVIASEFSLKSKCDSESQQYSIFAVGYVTKYYGSENYYTARIRVDGGVYAYDGLNNNAQLRRIESVDKFPVFDGEKIAHFLWYKKDDARCSL